MATRRQEEHLHARPGRAFAYQHNALWLGNGEISLFDDEGAPPVKPPSRGELIKPRLRGEDSHAHGQLVRTSGPLATGSQGNVQSLPGGGWMIGWGGLPNLTEFNAQGEIVYDAQLPRGENSYRVYREPWSGQPSEPPAALAKTTGAATAVYASWNGATTVASWQLLTGSSAAHLTAVSTTPKSGFETVIPAPVAIVPKCPAGVPCAPTKQLFQVRALSASGQGSRHLADDSWLTRASAITPVQFGLDPSSRSGSLGSLDVRVRFLGREDEGDGDPQYQAKIPRNGRPHARR